MSPKRRKSFIFSELSSEFFFFIYNLIFIFHNNSNNGLGARGITTDVMLLLCVGM